MQQVITLTASIITDQPYHICQVFNSLWKLSLKNKTHTSLPSTPYRKPHSSFTCVITFGTFYGWEKKIGYIMLKVELWIRGYSFWFLAHYFWYLAIGSLVAQMVKNLSAMWETWVRSLAWNDTLEEGMEAHSSILAWRIPMDRGAWQATVMGLQKVKWLG